MEKQTTPNVSDIEDEEEPKLITAKRISPQKLSQNPIDSTKSEEPTLG